MTREDQKPFDLTGAPRPWIGRYLWNRLGAWLHRRRHPIRRGDWRLPLDR